jgi:anaerobic selenocysteine-containing dehydrogenase
MPQVRQRRVPQIAKRPSVDGVHASVCRICEANCGILVTVDGGHVTRIEGNPQAASQGFVCAKGTNFGSVQHDPDRIRTALKRVGGPGEFEPCTYREAIKGITEKLREISGAYGNDAIGVYIGNPTAYDTGHLLWLTAFANSLGTKHVYSAGSQDTNSRMVASYYLYGRIGAIPFPDIKRTDYLFLVGANPVASHGSLWGVPRIREQLRDVVGRGGRVVVVDPRRTETARLFEHVGIQADTDAWLLAAMLNVIFEEGLEAKGFLAAETSGADTLRRMVAPITPFLAASRTGIDAERIFDLARSFASAGAAAAYGRIGACTASFGTLVSFLIDCLNVITGNLGRPGGSVFGSPPINGKLMGALGLKNTYDNRRSRIGNYPDVAGMMPSAIMPREIMTSGPGQMRALIVGAGNPLISTPDEASVAEALQSLDLLVCVDLYISDTARYAHYILPDQTFLERTDLDLGHMSYIASPHIQASRPVVKPPVGVRRAWKVYDDIARGLGMPGAFDKPWIRRLDRVHVRLSPRRVADLLIRTGPEGDWFGLRPRRLNIRKIESIPHGIVLSDFVDTQGALERNIVHADRRVQLDVAEIASEFSRLQRASMPDGYPLKLIGMREIRSHNSWLHNVPRLIRNRPQGDLRVNPADADRAGVQAGDLVRVTSPTGEVTVQALVTDEVVPGVVALPHGWGHRGGWAVANSAGGVNSNALTSCRDEDVEPLAGMTRTNGVPVRIERVPSDSGLEQRV